ncbi:two-component system, NtrC family, C4-dicarboxylate transport sensor histidine kinase DctB [Salipiger thiooxidans]|uniref:C4-dicarboxylate transport sensor protein DctB n=3 Tax=Salipiger TaxID=263377 RepID=A0A1G7H513_9RHOB|nr:two-component system, NtrC family, C4-dicarboxylate transport sensor histidine kinase DctB [Salipiger thiooxidans]
MQGADCYVSVMKPGFSAHRALIVALALLVTAVLSAVVWRSAYLQALDPVAARGESDLELASDRLVTQLQRFREFAVLTADHPALVALHYGGSRAAAEKMLLRAADRSGAALAVYADAEGRVMAQSAPGLPERLLAGDPFRRALHGALGIAHGAGPEDIERAFWFAAPSFGPDGTVRGALIVAVDLARLEQVWRGSLPAVFFTDAAGEVIATNRSELLHWRREGDKVVTSDGTEKPLLLRYPGGHTVWVQRFSSYVPHRALRLQADLPVIGMTGVLLVDVAPAIRLAGLQAAVVAAMMLFFGSLLWLALERRRALAEANAVLEERVSARTRALQQSNLALRREVSEREEAEAALKRAQAELVQASKLSALGKMSAGISHELNQPLMAIRSFAENGTAFLERGRQDRAAENLGRISDMANRMGRIIKNLRAFAKAEPEPARRVGLAAVVEGALEVLARRIEATGTEIDWRRPERATVVMAGDVRLGQVVVNLLSNAMDAMADSASRRIEIRVAPDDEAGLVRLTVRDTGPGIADPSRIFDPFYSTKEVGAEEGMGLGLSISYGIVEGFGGRLRGENVEGGALFTIELQQAREIA